MSTTLGYRYLGEEVPQTQPRYLTESEIDEIIRLSLISLSEAARTDLIVGRQYDELANSLRRDLRRQRPVGNVSLDRYVEYIRKSLLSSTLLIHDRLGTKATSATTADLQQQVISEKRGGSGKESGLNMLTIFDEIIAQTENRKALQVLAYPAKSLTDSELRILKRDLISINLDNILVSSGTENYNSLPEWYADANYSDVPDGHHYWLELNPVRMLNSGVLMSHVRRALLLTIDPKVRSKTRIFTSSYWEGRVDIFFSSNMSLQATAIAGSEHIYTKKEEIHIKGTRGVDWVNDKLVSPITFDKGRHGENSCITETRQLPDGRWITYYTMVPLLVLCLPYSHFLSWLNRAGIRYDLDTSDTAFYTSQDPTPLLMAYYEKPESHEVRIEIDYSGKFIYDFYSDKRFDTSRLVTNDFRVNETWLGQSASGSITSLEYLTLLRGVTSDVDWRHVQVIIDLMTSTGNLSGISIKGMDDRGVDSIQRFTFKQPESVLREEGAFGLSAKNNTVAASHFIGNPGVITGATLWRLSANPLTGAIGRAASPEYIASLRGSRIPRSTVSTQEIIRQTRENIRREDMEQAPLAPRTAISIRPGRISSRRIPAVVITRATSSNTE